MDEFNTNTSESECKRNEEELLKQFGLSQSFSEANVFTILQSLNSANIFQNQDETEEQPYNSLLSENNSDNNNN